MTDRPPARLERLARGAALQLAGKLTGRGAGFAAQMVLARVLGPAVYGVYGIGWTLFHMVGLVASLGLEHGAVLHASHHLGRDPDRLAAVLWRCLRLALVSGAAFGAGLALAAPLLAHGVFSTPELEPVLMGFGAGVVLVAGTRVAAASTRVSQRMRYSTLAEDLVAPVGHLAFVAVLLGMGWRLLAAVAAPVAAYAVAFAVALASLRLLYPGRLTSAGPADPPTGRLLAFSLATSLSGILGLLILWADRLLVGYYLPEAETGIYIVASQIALLFAVVLSAFNTVFSPMIAELYSKGEHRELEALFRTSTRWGIYLTIPGALAIVAFPAGLLGVVGEGYTAGALPLVLLVAGQMANLVTGAVGFLLVMSGRQNRLLALTAGGLVANVVLNALWIPRYGLAGAALATALSLGVLFTVVLLTVRGSLGLWPYDRRLVKGAVAALAAAGGLAVLRWAVDGVGPWHVAGAAALAYGVFAAALLVQGLDPEDRQTARSLLGRLGGGPGRSEGPP